jgi:Family of unknown function (DUF6184)
MKEIHGITILGFLAIITVSCAHHDRQSARATEPRAAQPTAEERRADERRADERRALERKERPSVGGGPAEPSSAVARIAAARCEREVRCNNVGTKEKYASRADCVARMQEDKRDEINAKDCPEGIDKTALNACISAIRDEACGNPLDTITRLVACRSKSICVK